MRYANYKPTGIAWLPEVPEGWEVLRLKWILNEIKNLSTTGKELPLSLTASNGLIPFSEKANRTMESASYVGAKIVEQGQIVFNRFKARLFAVAPCRGLVSPDYAVYSTKTDVEKQYLLALFATAQFRQAMNNQASGIGDGFSRLYSSELFKLNIPLPPLSTQRAIVAFLDAKCGKVNRLVVAKEKEVALLRELKQSMIAEAVTRGVRANRRLLPSGIPWLPEVPDGWEVLRLKWILNEIKNLSTTGEELPLSLTASNGLIPFSEKANRTMESASYVGAKIVEQGQIVFNRFKARLFAVAPCRGLVSSDYAVYSTKTDVEKQYLLALFAIPQFRQAMNNQASGIGDGFSRLYSSELFKLNIPVPPLAEQREIVAHVEARAAKMDAAVSGLEKEIAALKEYKQRLIADVVTGQRKVA